MAEQAVVLATSVAAASGQLTRTMLSHNQSRVEAISNSSDDVTLPGLEDLINELHSLLFRPQPAYAGDPTDC